LPRHVGKAIKAVKAIKAIIHFSQDAVSARPRRAVCAREGANRNADCHTFNILLEGGALSEDHLAGNQAQN
jgi:hypothetical protein